MELPRRMTGAVLMALLTATLLVAGCATDGRELADTRPGQTTTTRPAPPTSAPNQEAGSNGLVISSPDFAPGGELPQSATCAGGRIFPALTWSGVPPLAVELVVTLSDQTVPTEPDLLWLLAGIQPDLDGLEAGIVPVGAFESLNGFDNPGFGNPCLERLATGRRDLQFRLYALPQPSGVAPGETGDQALALVRRAAIESASVLSRIDNAP